MSTHSPPYMYEPWDDLLIAMINIDAARRSQEQFIYRTAHKLSTQDMTERVYQRTDFNTNHKDSYMIKSLYQVHSGFKYAKYRTQREEHDWTEPGNRRNR